MFALVSAKCLRGSLLSGHTVLLLLLLSLELLALLFFDPGTQFSGNEKKLRYAIQKSTKIKVE